MRKVIYTSILISFVFVVNANTALVPHANENIEAASPGYISIKKKLDSINLLINEDVKQALFLAKEVLIQAEQLDDSLLIAESNLTLGKGFNALGANIEALQYLSKALNIYRDLSDAIQVAYTLKEIGNIYYRQGEYLSALNYYNDVLSCGRSLKDTSLLTLALIGKGAVYGNINKLDSAMYIFEETFNLSRKNNDKSTEVHSLYNIGDVYRFTNRPAQALVVFKRLEEGYDVATVNSKILTSLYFSMSGAYVSIQNSEQARKYADKMWEALQNDPRSDHKMRYHFLSFQIDTLENNYSAAIENHIAFKHISDSLNGSQFKKDLANFQILYDLNTKEQEIERLMLDNELKSLSIKQKKFINYGSVAIIILLIILVAQVVGSSKKSKKKNSILQIQQQQLATANEELQTINDELHNQRKELEATLNKLKAAQSQLVHSEKMASLGVLAAGVAHEINNPLNFIQGSIYALENYIDDNLKDRHLDFIPILESLNLGVVRVANITNSLNHYSRRDNQITDHCDIHNIIDNSLLMLNNNLKNRIEIEKDYCALNFILKCNEGQLHQVMLNLLSNASQAIAETGIIKIKTRVIKNKLQIVVKDDGCGIAPENLDKITDPFFTTKEPGKGTGLGLSITQNIINEHHGAIEFESGLKKGTKVIIHLPIN